MEQDLCVPDYRFYILFPELVGIGSAVTVGSQYEFIYFLYDSRVSLPVGCRGMDFTVIEE